MRQITKKKQVAFASLAEIRQALATESERLADLGLKGGGPRSRVAASAHLLNWLACWFLKLIPAERERIARAGKVILDQIAASDVPVYFDLSSTSPSVPAVHDEPRRRGAVNLDAGRVDHVDRERDDPSPQPRHPPKRRP